MVTIRFRNNTFVGYLNPELMRLYEGVPWSLFTPLIAVTVVVAIAIITTWVRKRSRRSFAPCI